MNKSKKMKWTGGLVFILFVILIPGITQADLKEILLKFQPYITVQEEYSSNIDLTPKNKKDDFITSVYPGIRFSTLKRSDVTGELRGPSAEEEKYGIDLDYRLGLVFYAKETDNNYIGHNGTLNAWYTFASKLTFRVSEYLIRSEEPREQEYPGASPTYISGTFVDLTDLYLLGTNRGRDVYLRNVVTPAIEYKLGRDSLVSLSYRNNIYRTQDPTSEDSQEDFINPKLTYWFNIRNGLSLEYGLTFANFDRSPDFVGNLGVVRYTYRFNPRTSIFGEYSSAWRDFEFPGIDYNVQTPSLGVEHAFNPKLSGRVQLGYFWQSPKKGSGENGPYYNALLTQRQMKTTYALLFQGGYREDFYTSENQGFTLYHRAVGSVTHRLTEKASAGLSASYEWSKSKIALISLTLPENQRDNIWEVTGNVGYQLFRWLNLSLGLTYREDSSNISTRDYNEFRGMFRAEATYK